MYQNIQTKIKQNKQERYKICARTHTIKKYLVNTFEYCVDNNQRYLAINRQCNCHISGAYALDTAAIHRALVYTARPSLGLESIPSTNQSISNTTNKINYMEAEKVSELSQRPYTKMQ